MKILVIGGRGLIGRALVKHLSEKHEVLVAGRSHSDLFVDLRDSGSIRKMFEAVPAIDAVVCAAGEAKWDNFNDLEESDYYIGIESKLMGQVNLVRIGKDYINSQGSFTLTTGILADDPVLKTASAAMVNGAVHSFVQAVSLELDAGMRINAVSCGMVEDAYEKYKDFFPGHNPIPMQKMINGYVKCIEGRVRGQIIRIYD